MSTWCLIAGWRDRLRVHGPTARRYGGWLLIHRVCVCVQCIRVNMMREIADDVVVVVGDGDDWCMYCVCSLMVVCQ